MYREQSKANLCENVHRVIFGHPLLTISLNFLSETTAYIKLVGNGST